MTDASAAKQLAIAFIASAGDELARSRAAVLFGDEAVSDLIERIPDTGSSPGVGALRSVLGIFDDLCCPDVPPVEAACKTLMQLQDRDGSWCESADASEAERIFVTGMVAGYLAKTPYARSAALEAAADHLASLWSPERVKGSVWPATAAYFHCFAVVGHDRADAIVQWCGRELERGYRTNVYDAVQTARVFTLCRAHALPGAQLDRVELIERLVEEQRDDGSYLSRDDASRAAQVAHTLDALVALTRFT